MKMRILITFTWVALVSCIPAHGQWTRQNSSTGSDLKSVFFIGTDTGYAVGLYGVGLKTTDGGFT